MVLAQVVVMNAIARIGLGAALGLLPLACSGGSLGSAGTGGTGGVLTGDGSRQRRPGRRDRRGRRRRDAGVARLSTGFRSGCALCRGAASFEPLAPHRLQCLLRRDRRSCVGVSRRRPPARRTRSCSSLQLMNLVAARAHRRGPARGKGRMRAPRPSSCFASGVRASFTGEYSERPTPKTGERH